MEFWKNIKIQKSYDGKYFRPKCRRKSENIFHKKIWRIFFLSNLKIFWDCEKSKTDFLWDLKKIIKKSVFFLIRWWWFFWSAISDFFRFLDIFFHSKMLFFFFFGDNSIIVALLKLDNFALFNRASSKFWYVSTIMYWVSVDNTGFILDIVAIIKEIKK